MHYRIVFCLLFLFSAANHLHAQAIGFVSPDVDMAGRPAAICKGPQGEICVLQYLPGIGYKKGRLLLQKWNQQFWAGYPPMEVEELAIPATYDNQMQLCLHQGNLYAAGAWKPAGATNGGLAMWNGVNWVVPAGGMGADYMIHNDISVKSMVSWGSKLVVCGRFNRAGGAVVQNMAILENQNWKGVVTNTGEVNDLWVQGDTLYAAGRFTSIDGVVVQNLASNIAGAGWYALPSVNQPILSVTAHEAYAAFATADAVYSIQAGSLKKLDSGWNFKVISIGEMCFHGTELFCIGNFRDDNGRIYHLLKWNGAYWNASLSDLDVKPSGINPFYISSVNSSLWISGLFTGISGRKANYLAELKSGYSLVQGNVFLDRDNNCLYSGGDEYLQGVLLSLNDGESYHSTDQHGNYRFWVQQGNKCELTIFPAQGYKQGCLGNRVLVNLPTRDTMIGLNIPLTEDSEPDGDEIQIVSATGYRARHGYKNHYRILYHAGANTVQSEVHLHHTPGLVFLESDKPVLRREADHVVWQVTGDTIIRVEFLADHQVLKSGDTLDFACRVISSSRSETASSVLKQEVVSAYDPNDKQSNKTRITVDETSLDYHIRFQNLGNDSAVSVFIVDTISQSLPMQFIRVLGNSHQQQYKLNYKIRDHAIIWSFDQIMLPPKSTSGDVKSSGFVSMKAGLTSDLKVGDRIENQAHIYFDYQDPVPTNVAITDVVEITDPMPGSKGLQLTPNPATRSVIVNFEPFRVRIVELRDTQGRLILRKNFDSVVGKAVLDLPPLSDGIYFIRVDYVAGVTSGRLLISQGN